MTMCERTWRGEPPESFTVTEAPDLVPHDPNSDARGDITKSWTSFDPLATPDFLPTQIDVKRDTI